METKIGILVLALCTTFFNVQAQRRVVTTTRATSSEISDNLDLNAVASIFGDSENLEDFEHRLNDPKNRISNLDLNEDGYIDYLRVVENSSDNHSLVVIQAVLDQDVYQDVATIEVERSSNGNHRIQIVGDDYIYGSNYIIEPVFYRTPLIFSFFWGPHYRPWQSPYYWNYYPRWYSFYRPFSPFRYHRHIYAHINLENKYRRAESLNIHFSGDNFNRIRRNDYATIHPDRAFESRHQGLNNRNELIERRSDRSGDYQRNDNFQRSYNGVRPDRPSSGVGRPERKRPDSENSLPGYDEKSGQNQPREYNRDSNRNRPENNNQVRQRNETRDERRNIFQGITKKPGSVEGPVRPNREVRTQQRVERKSEPVKKEDQKEPENERRR